MRINAYCRRSTLSILALARLSKVGQPSLARFLNGERKTLTSTARIVLKFIDDEEGYSRHNQHNHATIPPEIEDAVRTTWDGNPRSAELLASLIRALKPALDAAAGRKSDHMSRGAG